MTTISVTQSAPLRRTWHVIPAIRDLVEGLEHWELWSTLGWHDIRQKYRRAKIGPFWLTLSMGMMIGGMAYLYAGVFGRDLDTYLPFVALGMIIFTFISTLATEGSLVFVSSAPMIVKMKAPFSIYVYQAVWRNLIILAHNIIIFAVVVVYAKVPLGWHSLLSIPGLLLVVTMGIWGALILGPLCARFRDVPPIVSSIMQIAFFMTPILWTPSSLPNREIFVNLNPFYYLLEVVRMPLMGEMPPLSIWLTVIGLNLVAAPVAIMFFARCRARIAYWV